MTSLLERKCVKCKVFFTAEKNHIKNCKECRLKNTCPHGRRESRCTDCGGKDICGHGRVVYQCRDCKGGGICQHENIRTHCKECRGTALCKPHGKQKNNCVECKGSGICEHDTIRSDCKECLGNCFCKHEIKKKYCKECDGSQICSHDKRKSNCYVCSGCEHGNLKYDCDECGSFSRCEHKNRKRYCKECKGSQICMEHGGKTTKSRCIQCEGSDVCKCCKSQLCNKYRPYCFRCYCYLNPDVTITKQYRTKEFAVTNYLEQTFDCELVLNKQLPDGCFKNRPDVRIECKDYVIFVEIDENQHASYVCENKRLMELFADSKFIPIVMIRINPDHYVDENNEKHPSCFRYSNKENKLSIDHIEFDKRMTILKETITRYIDNPPTKEVEEIKLFYNSK